MAEPSDTSGTPPRPGGGGGASGAGGTGGGSNSGGGGGSGGANRNRNRRNRNRNRPAGSGSSGGSGSGSKGGTATAQRKGQSQGKGQGSGGGRGGQPSGAQRSGGGGNRGGGNRGGGGGGNRSRSGGATRSRSSGQPKTSVALAPQPAAAPLDVAPGLGAPQIHHSEVTANRRRAIRLCGITALIPAVLLGLLGLTAVSWLVGIIAFVLAGLVFMYGLWRLAPAIAIRRIGARPVVEENDDPRLYNITEGLCATFGLPMPALHVVDDPVPNACALGRDAKKADLVVTSGLLRTLHPIELEGVIAHELAHVKRGDNGVSCIGITLGTLFGGEHTLRRCVGENREYRADVVGASVVRYPRGLLGALCTMMEANPPHEGSVFASPRFGGIRWVWTDPSVGHRGDPVYPGDLDATWVRAAALSEW